MDADFLSRLKTALEELGPELDKQNDAPKTALAGVGPDMEHAQRKFLSNDDKVQLQRSLRKLSDAELLGFFSSQARKKDQGIPVETWMSAGGNSTALSTAFESSPTITRALDTTSTGPLIRQDLEPVILELFIRNFPAWERIPKEPANGLVHAYNRQTSYGSATFMGELGTVTDSTSAFERATTPISILATRRGVTIKAAAAVSAGGMAWSPEQMELTGGLRAIAHTMQKTIFQGNASVSTASGAGDDEDGAYDAYAFDGLRHLLKGPSTPNTPVDCNPTGGTPDSIRQKINDAVISALQLAGDPRMAYLDPTTKGQIDVQQDANVRYTNPPSLVNVGVGVQTNEINTANGPIPLFVIPGDAIGHYTKSNDVSDIYLIDEQNWSVPYLGTDGPTVLDIPMGVGGQLTRQFIIFGMWGFAVKALQFHNKVRVRRS
jgi:hypothetical protein